MALFYQIVIQTKKRLNVISVPNKYQVCSKRSWDGQIKKWRRHLHNYDSLAAELKVDFKEPKVENEHLIEEDEEQE